MDDPFCGQLKVSRYPQPLWVEVVKYIQKPKSPTVAKAICH
jgi:hypothetical protein